MLMSGNRAAERKMKLATNLKINNKENANGIDMPWYFIYPFFLFHMLIFGISGFLLAYAGDNPDVLFLYMHGGLAITVYTVFYLVIFGRDEVKWMFINAALGLLGIYSQIGWLLSVFGKQINDFPIYVHVIPTLYFILYTFLVRQAATDLTRSRDNPVRKKCVEYCYVAISVAFYLKSLFLER